MDKIGHLVMTKSLSGNIHRAHKAALLFGSILPDLLVYTYLEDLKGFEPPTHGLEGRCSIQLSYRLIFILRF